MNMETAIKDAEREAPTFEDDHLIRPIKTVIRRPEVMVINLCRFDLVEFSVFLFGFGLWGLVVFGSIFEQINLPLTPIVKMCTLIAGFMIMGSAYCANYERRQSLKEERSNHSEKQKIEKKHREEAERLEQEVRDKRFKEFLVATSHWHNHNN